MCWVILWGGHSHIAEFEANCFPQFAAVSCQLGLLLQNGPLWTAHIQAMNSKWNRYPGHRYNKLYLFGRHAFWKWHASYPASVYVLPQSFQKWEAKLYACNIIGNIRHINTSQQHLCCLRLSYTIRPDNITKIVCIPQYVSFMRYVKHNSNTHTSNVNTKYDWTIT